MDHHSQGALGSQGTTKEVLASQGRVGQSTEEMNLGKIHLFPNLLNKWKD